MAEAKGKALLKSKTFWFNVIAVITTVADVLPPEYAVYATTIGNVILRLITSEPISGVLTEG